MYHLNKLIDQKLINKSGINYLLTPLGQRYIDKLSLEKFKPRIQPKIVTLLAVQNTKGEYLLYERSRQPFLGLVGFPYGKIHMGETIAGAAARELEEKTGLTGTVHHRGEAYLSVHEGADLIVHMLCHVFSVTNPAGDIKTDSEIGHCFWTKVTSSKDYNFMPGFWEIFESLKKEPDRFFSEIVK